MMAGTSVPLCEANRELRYELPVERLPETLGGIERLINLVFEEHPDYNYILGFEISLPIPQEPVPQAPNKQLGVGNVEVRNEADSTLHLAVPMDPRTERDRWYMFAGSVNGQLDEWEDAAA